MADLIDGDSNWIGVDGRRDPGELEQGLCSDAVNTRFDDGVPRPRKGIRKLPWLHLASSTLPWVSPHFTELNGAGVFNDPNGTLMLLVAGTGLGQTGVWAMTEDGTAQLITTPTGTTFPRDVHFEQCFGGVMLFRGDDLAPLYMKSLGAGFQSVVAEANTITGAGTENPTDGTAAIPAAKRGLWIGNRLVIPHARDLVTLSDYLNPTRYLAVRAQCRINQGSADELVAIAKFNDQSVVVFKEQSIYVIGSATGDLSAMVLDELTREYGCNAPKSIVNVGGDVWFLSNRRGIASVTQTAHGVLQGTNVPVSHPIQNLIDRINWQYAERSTAAMVDNRVYFAVPLDDARVVKGNLVESATYSGGGAFVWPGLIAGRRYRWVKGASDTNCVNGTETLTTTGDFVAQSTSVTLNGTVSVAVTAELRPVFQGVNNAVLVYDFKNRRWCGYDQSQALAVRDLIPYKVRGQQRLLVLTEDGYLNLYEDGAVDEVQYPEHGYEVELVIDSLPAAGNTFVFGGVTITAATASVNTGSTWGITGTLAAVTERFWTAATGGWSPTAAAPWTPANYQVERIGPYTFRFRSLRGLALVPTIDVTVAGTWHRDTAALPWFPYGAVSRIIQMPITHSFTTRGYRCQTDSPKRFRQMQVDVATWNPSWNIYELCEGVEEQHTIVSDWTRDRTKYYRPFTKADFVTTNANGDFCDPQRQDYSISLTATGSIYADGGLCLDQEQSCTARFRLRGAGRYVRLKFEGEQGVVAVASCQVLAEPGGNRGGVTS